MHQGGGISERIDRACNHSEGVTKSATPLSISGPKAYLCHLHWRKECISSSYLNSWIYVGRYRTNEAQHALLFCAQNDKKISSKMDRGHA